MIQVIAEIGVNWNGDFSIAKEMIHESKKAGADFVKFQSFNEELIKNHPAKKKLIKTSISKQNIEEINKIAKLEKIEWFCTPMYEEAVDLLDPFINRFKVREYDGRELLKNKVSPLLKKIFATKKDIIISSETVPPKLKKDSKMDWLYCVPKYPCMLTEINFKNLDLFSGYSNHCQSIMAPITAAVLGARIIEIHITPNKKSKKFIDNNVSFDYSELKNIITSIKEMEQITKS